MPSIGHTAVVVLALGVVAPAQAQSMSVKEYENIMAGTEGTVSENALNISWYVAGLNYALFYVGGSFHATGAAPLVCLPTGRSIGVQEYLTVINNELKARPEVWRKDANMPIARVMFEGLRREFPCR